jgi:hypothetical protein
MEEFLGRISGMNSILVFKNCLNRRISEELGIIFTHLNS